VKKLLVLAILVAVIGSLVAAPVLAKGKDGQAGKSNIGHLYLYEKNPADWSIVDGGAWGKMEYNLSGATFDFVFNGHALPANTGYSLVYYRDYVPEVWPHPVTIIAQGTSNAGGNIHLGGSVELGKDLPELGDINTGAKIWLVLTDDIVGGSLSGWNPTEYLFENNLITYTDTD
jgi:hypothetical protein